MPRSFGVTNAAPYDVAPVVGEVGDTYFNTADSSLYVSDGTAWQQVKGGGDSGGGQPSYWFSRIANTDMPSSVPVAVETPELASGFTLAAGYQGVDSPRCDVAGMYAVTATFTFYNAIAAGTGTNLAHGFVYHVRGAAPIANEGGSVINNGSEQLVISAIFDLAVGDLLSLSAYSTNFVGDLEDAGDAVNGASSFFVITPVGGSPGPEGPTGPPGGPVPVGGTTGQTIVKSSDVDFETEWQTPRWSKSFQEYWTPASPAWVDMGILLTFTDDSVWPVETVAVMRANAFVTGWNPAGFIPYARIYSDSFPDPWTPGFGKSYCKVVGLPFAANEIDGAAAMPQILPSLVAVDRIPAGLPIVWTLALTVHGASGPIQMNGGYHVLLERFVPTAPSAMADNAAEILINPASR